MSAFTAHNPIPLRVPSSFLVRVCTRVCARVCMHCAPVCVRERVCVCVCVCVYCLPLRLQGGPLPKCGAWLTCFPHGHELTA